MSGAEKNKKAVPTPEQRRAADPRQSVWVAANAGSGKTRVLVDRVVRLLLAGAEPQAILCLTYTKAAAAEMSSRLFARLGDWVPMPDAELDEELRNLGERNVDATTRREARKLFARALETPGGLRIQTIHAFAERLLQLFPVESGLAPGFRVMTEIERRSIEDDAFQKALGDNDEAVQAGWRFLESGDVGSVIDLAKTAEKYFSGSSGLRQNLTNPEFLLTLEQNLSEALGGVDARASETIEADLLALDQQQYKKAADAFAPYGIFGQLNTPAFLRRLSETASLEDLGNFFLTGGIKPRVNLISKDAQTENPALAEWLDSEKDRVSDQLQKLALRQILDATVLVTTAFAGVQGRIIAEKRRLGLYDFDDLIARTAQLLSQAESAQWVLNKLDAGISHILVDEAQDTSPAQWQIIKSLTEEFFAGAGRPRPNTRTVFAVGDIKQSIFGFQGADTSAFTQTRGHFENQGRDQFSEVGLTISYRSTPDVLRVVDKVFAEGSAARLAYGATAAEERDHQAERSTAQGVFELWPVLQAEKNDPPDHWQEPVDRLDQDHPHLQVAQLIATQIKSWIGSRINVATGKVIEPQDILILVQHRGGVIFQGLIAALRRANVPVAGADKLQLNDSMIIKDLLAMAQALRLPQDDYALACVLKSPLVPHPIDEETLLALALGRGTKSLWQCLSETPSQDRNANYLDELRERAMSCGPFAFFSGIVQRSRRDIRERLGSEAEDAAAEFLNLAMEHEQAQDLSIASFTDRFSRAEIEIKREMEQATGEVRIMTVHGAKGLEAPIVILADAAYFKSEKVTGKVLPMPETVGALKGFPLYLPETIVTPQIVSDWKTAMRDKALAERYRLLYVAMTRARDELYVFGSIGTNGDKTNNWHAIISKTFEVPDANCPVREVHYGDHTVLRHGAEAKWITPVEKTADVVRVPPPWLTSNVNEHPETRPNRLAARDTESEAINRGVAIHRILEMLDGETSDDRVASVLRQAAKLGLHQDDVHGVIRFITSGESQQFFTATSRAEVDVRGTLPNGDRVSNRIDRLVEHGTTTLLLDYKTGTRQRLDADHPYIRQMAKYAWLMSAANPGRNVRAALLWTQGGALEWIEPERLSQAFERVLQATP